MKEKFLTLLIILSFLLIYSCEDTKDDINLASKIEGQWRCEEHSSVYKSAMDFYTVYIQINSVDSNKIFIENFYQLGSDIQVEATISGMDLNIVSQTVGQGFTIDGHGTVKSNYSEINFSYNVDDGSGQIDHVTAVYTKSY